MRYLLFLSFILFALGCEKRENEKEYIFNESEFRVSSITQNSVIIKYKVDIDGLKQTRLMYSKDSSELVFHSSTLTIADPIYNKTDSSFSCELKNLEAYTKYWFQIYFKDIRDSVGYSSIYSAETKGFNIRWLDSFSKKALREQKIGFYGDNVDIIKTNYIISMDEIVLPLTDISMISNGSYKFALTIPTSIAYGKHAFTVRYKGEIVFNDDLEIFKGVLKFIGSNTTLGGFSNSFCYNEEIYVYYNPNFYSKFWKYNPQTNIWIQLPAPNLHLNLPEFSQGYELYGKIYFPPFTCTTLFTAYCSRNQDDEKYIYSYNPDLYLWEKHALINNETVPVYSGLYSSFVYDNKLFCFVMHNNVSDHSICLLKMFDPTDYSWQTVVDSVPFSNAWGCTSAVVNNKIYVLASLVRKQELATTYFKNELYLFDLETKTFIKKSIWDDLDIGSLNGYLFGYEGRLYFYGGQYSVGYSPYATNNSYEYNPETDKWIPLASCYFSLDNTAAYGGFLHNINNRIYVGFGQGSRIYEFLLN